MSKSRDLAVSIREKLITVEDPRTQYDLRVLYESLVVAVVASGEVSNLFDVWALFSSVATRATRGFFLDLWDLWVANSIPAKSHELFNEDLLRAFVSLRYEGFSHILASDHLLNQEPWKQQIAADLMSLLTSVDMTDCAEKRRTLYSLVNLYNCLYPDPCRLEGQTALQHQLEAASRAEQCRFNGLIDLANPAVGNLDTIPVTVDNLVEDAVRGESLALGEPPFTGEADTKGREATQSSLFFTQIFAYLYQKLDHWSVRSLTDVVTDLSRDILTDSRVDVMSRRLLLHWASQNLFWRTFIEEKTNFRFRSHAIGAAKPQPSYRGCDNYIALLGASGVGKTSFLLASSTASVTPQDLPTLTLRHVKGNKEAITQLTDAWKSGLKLPVTNRDIYVETKVNGLCRFTLWDIPGTDIDPLADWVKRHFRNSRPSGLLLMFERRTREPREIQSHL